MTRGDLLKEVSSATVRIVIGKQTEQDPTSGTLSRSLSRSFLSFARLPSFLRFLLSPLPQRFAFCPGVGSDLAFVTRLGCLDTLDEKERVPAWRRQGDWWDNLRGRSLENCQNAGSIREIIGCGKPDGETALR